MPQAQPSSDGGDGADDAVVVIEVLRCEAR